MDEMSSLRDISRPYVGEYKCKRLQFGGEDELERFEYIKLELKYGGTFRCSYLDTQGNEGEYSGKYKISEENAEITLSAVSGGEEKKFVFPYKKGSVLVTEQLNGKLLFAEFSMVE